MNGASLVPLAVLVGLLNPISALILVHYTFNRPTYRSTVAGLAFVLTIIAAIIVATNADGALWPWVLVAAVPAQYLVFAKIKSQSTHAKRPRRSGW